jgi:hypothetical protein
MTQLNGTGRGPGEPGVAKCTLRYKYLPIFIQESDPGLRPGSVCRSFVAICTNSARIKRNFIIIMQEL